MNYKKLGEQIARQFYGGDLSADAGLEKQDFNNYVQMAYAFKVRKDYWENLRMSGERAISESWLVDYTDQAVEYEESTDTYYTTLPTQILDLPHGMGIYHVSRMKDWQNPFIPEELSASFLYMRNPQDYITYTRNKTRITYSNFDPAIERVFMRVVPLVAEDIPDEFTMEIADIVLNQFLKVKQVPEDKLNNANPNKSEIANAG